MTLLILRIFLMSANLIMMKTRRRSLDCRTKALINNRYRSLLKHMLSKSIKMKLRKKEIKIKVELVKSFHFFIDFALLLDYVGNFIVEG